MRIQWALVAVGVAACMRAPTPGMSPYSSTKGFDKTIVDGVARIREATRPYQSLDSAVAHGYPKAVPACLVHEHHGAMGYHHVNRDFVDNKIELDKPEILLYERLADGSYHLNGVEFIVPFRVWPRDSVSPTLMGRKMYREDNLKIWYTHVWLWTNNTDGLFSNFNPSVQCNGPDRQVYKPTVDPNPLQVP